jgi:hypothetical protein
MDIGIVSRHLADGTALRYKPTANTDAARGTALISAIAASSTGEMILIGPGTYVISADVDLTMLAGQRWIGAGMEATYIKFVEDASPNTAPRIVVPNSGTFELANFRAAVVESDESAIGAGAVAGSNASSGTVEGVLRNVRLDSETIAWQEGAAHISLVDMHDCRLKTAQHTLSWGALSNGSILNLYNCEIQSVNAYGGASGTEHHCLHLGAFAASPGTAQVNVYNCSLYGEKTTTGGTVTLIDQQGGNLFVNAGTQLRWNVHTGVTELGINKAGTGLGIFDCQPPVALNSGSFVQEGWMRMSDDNTGTAGEGCHNRGPWGVRSGSSAGLSTVNGEVPRSCSRTRFRLTNNDGQFPLPKISGADMIDVEYIVEVGSVGGATGVTLLPNASDTIRHAGTTGGAGKMLINSPGSDRTEDYVHIKCNGTLWFVADFNGTWALEP